MNPQEQNNPNMVVQPTLPETKKCNHLPIIIILIILFIGGCAFGGYELWQNNTLREENTELKTTIEQLSKSANNQQDIPSNQVLEYEYVDDYTPPTTYKVKLDYNTGELYVHEYHSCSAVDCEGDEQENTIILTSDEMKKISTITSQANYDKDALSSALSCLTRDSEVMGQKDEETWELIKEYDLDNNGILTYREFGNNYLNVMTNETQSEFEYQGWIDCQPSLSEEEAELCVQAEAAGYPYIAY